MLLQFLLYPPISIRIACDEQPTETRFKANHTSYLQIYICAEISEFHVSVICRYINAKYRKMYNSEVLRKM